MKPHSLTLSTSYQKKKDKEGIHNHTGQKPGALDRWEALVYTIHIHKQMTRKTPYLRNAHIDHK
jgi:hypothetical protein